MMIVAAILGLVSVVLAAVAYRYYRKAKGAHVFARKPGKDGTEMTSTPIPSKLSMPEHGVVKSPLGSPKNRPMVSPGRGGVLGGTAGREAVSLGGTEMSSGVLNLSSMGRGDASGQGKGLSLSLSGLAQAEAQGASGRSGQQSARSGVSAASSQVSSIADWFKSIINPQVTDRSDRSYNQNVETDSFAAGGVAPAAASTSSGQGTGIQSPPDTDRSNISDIFKGIMGALSPKGPRTPRGQAGATQGTTSTTSAAPSAVATVSQVDVEMDASRAQQQL